MPDLFTNEYEFAKIRWEKARETYDETTRLYDAIYIMLKHQYKELDEATKLFNNQQSIVLKNAKTKLKLVKKEA